VEALLMECFMVCQCLVDGCRSFLYFVGLSYYRNLTGHQEIWKLFFSILCQTDTQNISTLLWYLIFLFFIFYPLVYAKTGAIDQAKIDNVISSQHWFWFYLSNIKQVISDSFFSVVLAISGR